MVAEKVRDFVIKHPRQFLYGPPGSDGGIIIKTPILVNRQRPKARLLYRLERPSGGG